VTGELKDPPHDKERDRHGPEAVHEEGDEKQGQGKSDQRDPEGVAETVDGMLMARRVLRDPLVPSLAA
jgi:hypothetical protein